MGLLQQPPKPAATPKSKVQKAKTRRGDSDACCCAAMCRVPECGAAVGSASPICWVPGEATMLVKEFSEGEPFRCAGNEFVMLLPRETTGACEVVLQMVRPGATTPSNSHETFMQVYLIWSGEAEVHIGGESERVKAPAVAFVPRRTEHWVVNLSAERELHYLYMSVWPEGIPNDEIEGGWKQVYAGIIDSYVSRGYPVDAE